MFFYQLTPTSPLASGWSALSTLRVKRAIKNPLREAESVVERSNYRVSRLDDMLK